MTGSIADGSQPGIWVLTLMHNQRLLQKIKNKIKIRIDNWVYYTDNEINDW